MASSKDEAVIFPLLKTFVTTSLFVQLNSMASISAIGCLSVGKILNSSTTTMRWHNPITPTSFHESPRLSNLHVSNLSDDSGPWDCRLGFDRRDVVISSVGLLASAIWNTSNDGVALASSEYADMPAIRGRDYGKTKMRYPDYTETESGLQYKDLRAGSGPKPKMGETVVVDWDGYTIGYYGRIFEARNKTKGGSFEGNDKEFYKFKIGYQEVIPAFEEAVSGMALGGIRRCCICLPEALPPELGYPGNDYNNKGPRPTTFSGQRALDFVLRNQGLIDKTLLFDIELLKIIPN
ncbi:peptidyl-prolyl cis-trans isomerase FKBP19, chloroplastic isoform X2 [Cornus florida]|uniref:peptidyl-prolyl cis-trans isomerase FKBP19, chloroplastic isoform X2 n=1 Tax=Cornus florida TaxID=4283 RepID=UPI00289F325E|nr:peptidyl-prolyl cis-trans isomerase FKBP19, chloroplastic isoform X2 [Cornus florida]